MHSVTRFLFIPYILFIVFVVVILIAAQFWLVRQENKYLGLILPLLLLIAMLPFGSFGRGGMHRGGGIFMFFIYLIPALVLVDIYYFRRKKLGLEIIGIKPKQKDPVEEASVNVEAELKRMDDLEKMDLDK